MKSLGEELTDALKDTPLENTHRVEIFVDGKFLMGTTTTHNPKCHEDTIKMLKDFVAFMEAPSVPIKDL